MVILTYGKHTVKIDSGELVGYILDTHEIIHQKGSPGWRNSDTEMFPIIGPTADADYQVKTPKGIAIQDQHGLLRELLYNVVQPTDTIAIFKKEYTAGTRINNSKYPEKSSVKELYWPYNFKFEKHFELSKNGLTITFKISGDIGMPFMLGYHPAFKLYTREAVVETGKRTIRLDQVLHVGNRALPIENCNNLTLKDSKTVEIKTRGFANFMLWTEVPNMICIEPITFYPYAVEQHNLNKGFMILNHNEVEFVVQIIPEQADDF